MNPLLYTILVVIYPENWNAPFTYLIGTTRSQDLKACLQPRSGPSLYIIVS